MAEAPTDTPVRTEPEPPSAVPEPRKTDTEPRRGVGSRWFWSGLAIPGTVWLCVLFIAPLYVVLAILFGGIDPILRQPVPVWNPLDWDFSQFTFVMGRIFGPDAYFRPALIRTVLYVTTASLLCLLVAYPVAYFVARFGGRWKGLLLAALIAPFWISYMMRMLAWVNLLQTDGLVNKALSAGGLFNVHVAWLQGHGYTVILGLVYGYVPYMILPLYAGLDRAPSAMLEAARDLGASRFQTFWRVTWPLTRTAVVVSLLVTSLPMLGDYFTVDLLSGSPSTSMIGNLINNSVLTPGQTGQAGAFVLIVLVVSVIPMFIYLRSTRSGDGHRHVSTLNPVAWWRNPWRKPWGLALITFLYLAWSLLPVAVAVLFSFNAGRSRVTWQGFSMRWYYGDPLRSVWHDASLHTALTHTLWLGVLATAITVPLGVAMALGLDRWRGRIPSGANLAVIVSFVLPEILMAVSLLFVATVLVSPLKLGTSGQVLGLVTFQLSWPVVIVRARLLTIGRDYEEAAVDLGASPAGAVWRVLLKLLYPAIFASAVLVFADVIDDFILVRYLSGDSSTETVSIKVYNTARAAPTPALNALTSLLLLTALVAVTLGYLGYRWFTRGEKGSSGIDVFAGEA